MKLTKNTKLLFFRLSLILSLVSFNGIVSHLPREGIKTSVIIGNYNEDTRFSIKYKNAAKNTIASFFKYSNYCFKRFQSSYNIKSTTAFKDYKNRALWYRLEELHTKTYSYSRYYTFYNGIM